MKDHFYDITLFIKFETLIEIFDLSLLAIFSDDFEILMNFSVKKYLRIQLCRIDPKMLPNCVETFPDQNSIINLHSVISISL